MSNYIKISKSNISYNFNEFNLLLLSKDQQFLNNSKCLTSKEHTIFTSLLDKPLSKEYYSEFMDGKKPNETTSKDSGCVDILKKKELIDEIPGS